MKNGLSVTISSSSFVRLHNSKNFLEDSSNNIDSFSHAHGTVIHEYGHRLNYYLGTKYSRDLWDLFQPHGYPSDYPKNSIEDNGVNRAQREYFADTFMFYIMDERNMGLPSWRTNPRDINTIKRFVGGIDKYETLKEYFKYNVLGST